MEVKLVTQRKSIKQNIAYQTFYEILAIILPLITSPYISRIIGAEGLGIFSFTYSIAYYFQIFGMLGIKFYGNRLIAQVREDQDKTNVAYSEVLVLHILFSVASTVIYLIYSIFLSQYVVYSLLQSIMVIATVFDVSWLFFGLEEFKTTVLRNTIIKLVSVLAIFLFVHNRNDLWVYILIMASSQLFGNLMLFKMAKRYVTFIFPKWESIRLHIKPMLILFIPVISLSLFKYMDKIMLGLIGDKIELGYYENAEKILNIPLGVILSCGSVMMPKIANLMAKNDQKSVNKYIHLSIKYMSSIAIAMAFGMAAIAQTFAPLFWGKEFIECGYLIMLLAISLPFSTISNIVRNQDLIPNGKDRGYGIAIIFGALLNLIINYTLIPTLQSTGVCVGTIISEIVVCIAQFFWADKKIDYRHYILEALVYFFPGVIMYTCVRFIGKILGASILSLICQCFIGIVVYSLLTLIYFFIQKDEVILGASDTLKKFLLKNR